MTAPPAQTGSPIGIAGTIIGFIALCVAFTSPWIADAIDPPSRSLEEVTVDFASRIAKVAKAKAFGEEYVGESRTPVPSRFIFPAVIAAGMLAAGLGIASLIRSERKTIAQLALGLGIGAAVVQWSIMIAGALILLCLVMAIITFFGGGL